MNKETRLQALKLAVSIGEGIPLAVTFERYIDNGYCDESKPVVVKEPIKLKTRKLCLPETKLSHKGKE